MKDHCSIDRLQVNSTNNCFITLKDHKENFENHQTVRLINPAKNELGRISKQILENINKQSVSILQINQWKSSENVINWFNNIKNKNKQKFLIFDIKEFYHSIKEKLLNEALAFAKTFVSISKKDEEIIKHSKKSLLFNGYDTYKSFRNKKYEKSTAFSS